MPETEADETAHLRQDDGSLASGGGDAAEGPVHRGGGWWRALLSALSVAIAAVLVPVSIVGASLLAAFSAGSVAVLAVADSAEIAPAPLTAVYETLVGPMAHLAVLATVLGVFVGILGWALGDWSPSRRLRDVVGDHNRSARHGLKERGLDTGRFGRWLGGHRVLVRAVMVVLALVWLVLLPSLSFGDIVLVVVLALLGTWALELLQQRPDELTSVAAPTN